MVIDARRFARGGEARCVESAGLARPRPFVGIAQVWLSASTGRVRLPLPSGREVLSRSRSSCASRPFRKRRPLRLGCTERTYRDVGRGGGRPGPEDFRNGGEEKLRVRVAPVAELV
jgi:hypothetical protein